MSIEILNCEQGSLMWHEARRGVPTASCFANILSKGRGSAPSRTRQTYLLTLAGEILTGKPASEYQFTGAHMERGRAMEAEARDLYAMVHDAEPLQVGFIRNTSAFGITGCSPDSTVGTGGLLEIKTKLPHLQLELLLAAEFPDEHKAQVQGQLWVAEREWCDFVSYWPGLPPFEARVHRDEPYISALKVEVQSFCDELAATVEKFQRAA